MPNYILSKDAEEDLREIIRYTRSKWGIQQVNRYREILKQQLEMISSGEAISRQYSKLLPDVYFTRAGNHLIFYLKPESKKPIVIGLIHEARDIPNRLASRL